MTVLLDLEPCPNGLVALRCSYDEAAVAQFKTMPGCRWDPDDRVWFAPAEAAAILAARLEKARVVKTRRNGVDKPPTLDQLGIDASDVGGDLYVYQQEGVDFLLARCAWLGSGLLADDLGLGKSAQALHAIEYLNPWGQKGRVLILCPAVVVEHWREEIKLWLEAESTVLMSREVQRHGGDWPGFAVVSYDTFRSILVEKAPGRRKFKVNPERLAPASIVVLDELHYLSNGRSQRSKAVRAYLNESRPEAVIGLSGTPMTARPRDLWHPLDLLWPGRFGSFFKFTERYAEGHHESIPGVEKEIWQCDGASNLDELRERLKPLMLRRTKSQVIELPERQRIVMPIALPEYVTSSMSAAYADLAAGTNAIQHLLASTEDHKLSAAVELAKDLVVQGRRPLVLTTRRHTADHIGKKLNAPVATGEVDAKKRRKVLLSGKGAAVSTVYAVTTGINLTEFDCVIFVGLDWVPSTLLQAEARLHRIGQKRSVTYYYLIGLHSIDEVIRSKVVERLEHFQTLIGGDDSDEEQLAGALDRQGKEDLIGEIVEMVRAKARRE